MSEISLNLDETDTHPKEIDLKLGLLFGGGAPIIIVFVILVIAVCSIICLGVIIGCCCSRMANETEEKLHL